MIKKTLLVLVGLAIMANAVQGQITQKGSSSFQLGYGFPSAMQIMGSVFKFALTMEDEELSSKFKYSGVGPAHFRYEYMLGGRIGLGLSVNGEMGRFNFTTTYRESDSTLTTSTIDFNLSSINALARVNFHFIRNPRKVDIYYGAGFGYALTRVKLDEKLGGYEIDPDAQESVDEFNKYLNGVFKAVPIAMESVFGIKVPFGAGVGMYFEVGYSKALCQLGFYGKLGGGKGFERESWKWY